MTPLKHPPSRGSTPPLLVGLSFTRLGTICKSVGALGQTPITFELDSPASTERTKAEGGGGGSEHQGLRVSEWHEGEESDPCDVHIHARACKNMLIFASCGFGILFGIPDT